MSKQPTAMQEGVEAADEAVPHRYIRQALAQEIAAENTLITNRMTWNLTFQGFLFTGYALALGETGASAFVATLPLAGIAAAVLAVAGVAAALWQIATLQSWWSEDLERWGPQPFSTKGRAILGAVPPLLTPIVVILAWVRILS